MNKLVKPVTIALSIAVIAFILLDKIKPDYKYYEHGYKYSQKDGVNYQTGKWIEITQEKYEIYKDPKKKNSSKDVKKKNVYTIPLIFSIAVAVASFTFLYKPEK